MRLVRRTSISVAILMLVTTSAGHSQATAPAPAINLQGDKSHPPAPETLKVIQGMINWDQAPAMPLNPQGLHLRFAQFDKRKIAGGKAVVYRAYASGAPTGQRYSLVSWIVGQQLQTVVAEVWLNDHGLLMSTKPIIEQQTADSMRRSMRWRSSTWRKPFRISKMSAICWTPRPAGAWSPMSEVSSPEWGVSTDLQP